MGRVPTAQEVFSGAFSDTPRGREAGQFSLGYLFPDGVSRLTDDGRPIFKSACVYGSTIDGHEVGKEPTIRSDLDMVIVHTGGPAIHNHALRAVSTLSLTVQQEFGVYLEAQLHPPGGDPGEKDPGYASHIFDIVQRYPAWRVGNPAEEFTDRLVPLDDKPTHMMGALSYLIHKMLNFDHAEQWYVGNADNQVMQRAMEMPSAIGRKVLPAVCAPGEGIPPVSDKPAMRALMEEKIAECFYTEASEVLANMRWLSAKDGQLTDLLLETLHERRVIMDTDVASDEARAGLRVLARRYDEWIEDHYLEAVIRAGALCRKWGNFIEDRLVIVAPERLKELDSVESASMYSVDDDY